MPFVSKDEKEILNLLILYSGLYLLTENEALDYIKEKLGKKISRRRYYYYRSHLRLQTLDTYTLFRYLQNECFLDNKEYYKYHPDPIYTERILGKSNKIVRRSIFDIAELFKDLNSDIQTSEKNFKDISSNATIRKEYVTCGKPYCKTKHGPYYYAYWRDHRKNKKLCKKYIGKVDPRQSNNDKEVNRNVNESLLYVKSYEKRFVNRV